MQDLNVTLVQMDIVWESPEANRQKIERMLKNVKTNLVVLPEMFTTGFSMEPKDIAENSATSETLVWMKELAGKLSCAVVGSLTVKDGENYYNRAYFVKEDGSYETYDKRHLFSMAGEDVAFTAGNELGYVSYLGWRIRLFICYDLRFPVWNRNDGSRDLYIYVANWPEARVSAWESLLCARAVENQCYVVGVNRVGRDGNEITYNGRSLIFDSKGHLIKQTTDGQEDIITANLSVEELRAFREKFPVFNDSDEFDLKLT